MYVFAAMASHSGGSLTWDWLMLDGWCCRVVDGLWCP